MTTMPVTPGEDETLSASSVETALSCLGGASADQLAGRICERFGAERLRMGPDPLVEETTVAWAIEALAESFAAGGSGKTGGEGGPGGDVRVRVLADDGSFVLPLRRLGDTAVFAGAATLQPGTAFRWNYEVTQGDAGRRTLLPDIPEENVKRIRGRGRPLEVYATHPESRPRPGVPRSHLHARLGWKSQVFQGTTRDWWFSVPEQCASGASGEPACVMVFQDGERPKDFVPPVFDNLIAQGDMPVTVGVYINPGVFDSGERNRSFEYDTLSDQYARFLLEEILPEVERTVTLRQDAQSRAISGLSSGGICSFTVAWERPDAFSKVLSWIGSFTDIAGGHNYPPMIRKSPPRPIRVFLQDGKNDLNVPAGDWWLANLEMASALEFASYDYTTAWGDGFHSAWHGRAILPDSLRWLWRGYQA